MATIQQLLSSFNTAGVSGSYLDGLATTPQVVLSISKKISTATNAIRVRRSSDNAEQNIGFSGDALDTASLSTFVGGNSGFVTTIYDQTGNGFNAVQATAGNQPRIVNAGVYDGKIVFDGTSDSLRITSLTLGTPYFGAYLKVKQDTSAVVKIIIETGTAVDGGVNRIAIYEYSSLTGWVLDSYNNGASTNRAFRSANTIGMHQMTFLANRAVVGTGELLAWLDGAAKSGTYQTFAEQTGNYTTNDIYIGARAGTSLFSNMDLDTMVIYNTDSSAIRANIEAIVA